MKTHSIFPLVSLSLTVGMLLAEGLTLAMLKETLAGVGGVMIVLAVAIAVCGDRIYRNCRIVEADESATKRPPAAPVKDLS